uniref:Uncharacterized protein ycf23 n=2 Tax=Gracilariopsis TaxID=2781 RepID=A0A1C9CEX8_9FLOR|nr:hypothetical protein [Gracilariopsis lemaneiformis]YP_009294681.1 hypothetical protein Gch_082 [Gracilariopsis chorda]AJO68511.1 hypothetical protein [Gracilariopsis lemaneiformis]AML79944.1 hypothetical protein [Gracilariopsis lemaneiformis]AOM66941.1 hypothetical protein Gch_082 [Gracilariopsis chorda]
MTNLLYSTLEKKIKNQRAVKIITGLDNFHIDSIIKIVKAAEIGKASYVDIASNPEIVCIIKSITNLPICVSSIDPKELYNCAIKGADIVEIGNFDRFYSKKIVFSSQEILNLAQETKNLIPNKPICITIPHTFLLKEQISLAVSLKKLGISMIQTEGLTTKSSIYYNNITILNSMKSSASALSSTYALCKNIDIPIIAASGINCLSASVALSYGASIVGIGSSVSKYNTIYDMAKYIYEIVYSISTNKSLKNIQLNYIDHINYMFN